MEKIIDFLYFEYILMFSFLRLPKKLFINLKLWKKYEEKWGGEKFIQVIGVKKILKINKCLSSKFFKYKNNFFFSFEVLLYTILKCEEKFISFVVN